ncbi:MAG: hypothetical protein RR844_08835 [Clostridium sp.]
MKNKTFSLLMVVLLSFLSVPVTAFADDTDDFMWRIPVMAEETEEVYEALESDRSCHESYKTLVDAMMKVKDQGGYTKAEIKAVHKFYEGQVAGNSQLPTDSKELLNLLYKNNIITKSQYDQTLAALQ